MNKQALTEALAFADAPGFSLTHPDFWIHGPSYIAAARLVERLLPGECGSCKGTGGLWSGGEEMPQFSTCSACRGSGQVWDEGIVEAVAEVLAGHHGLPWPIGMPDPNHLATNFRAEAKPVLSALVGLLTEKVE